MLPYPFNPRLNMAFTMWLPRISAPVWAAAQFSYCFILQCLAVKPLSESQNYVALLVFIASLSF